MRTKREHFSDRVLEDINIPGPQAALPRIRRDQRQLLRVGSEYKCVDDCGCKVYAGTARMPPIVLPQLYLRVLLHSMLENPAYRHELCTCH